MGYDIQIVQKVDAPTGDYIPQDPEDPGYFRFSMVGMQAMLRIMSLAGAIDDEMPLPRWPPHPAESIDESRADELVEHFVGIEIHPPPTPEETERIKEYLSKRDTTLRVRSPRPGLVPAFKFRTNNGWLVSPQECNRIADCLRGAVESDPESMLPGLEQHGLDHDEAMSWVLGWAAYNAFAAENGGYRVF